MPTTGYELYCKARQAVDAGQHSEAIALLQESLNHEPHFKTFELLGVSLKAVGRNDDALTALERALELNPRSSKTACILAAYLLEAQEVARSKAILLDVLKRTPTYGPARELLDGIPN